jgi:hypothetical protein
VRGLKGLWWEPEQYRSWPAFLAEAGYDLFMLCYTICPETSLSWRQPLRDAERAVIRQVAEDCAQHGITLCLAFHPLIGGQAWAPEHAAVRFHPTSGQGWFLRYWQARRPAETLRPDPPIRYGSEDDLALLVEKCQQAVELGVGAIALCLDDVDPGATPDGFSDLASAHLWLVQELKDALMQPGFPSPDTGRPRTRLTLSRVAGEGVGGRGPQAGGVRLLVVPTYYWTEGARAHPNYTAGLARGLPPDVDLFWTGTEVRSHAITAAQACEAADLFGRKPIVWLNYASNDSFRFAIQLPPDLPPAHDLLPETVGLLLNSTRQVGLAHLDALVIGAYLGDPTGYDHESAVHEAVRLLVGEEAAPLLHRVLDAWRVVPDVRTLANDLESGGRPFLDNLLSTLRPALVELDAVLPALSGLLAPPPPRSGGGGWGEGARGTADAGVGARELITELAAGVERLRLLVNALDLRARLAAADPEAACDAEAVLTLGPLRDP